MLTNMCNKAVRTGIRGVIPEAAAMAVDLAVGMDHPEDPVGMEQLGQEEEHQAAGHLEDHVEGQVVDLLGRPEVGLLGALADRQGDPVGHLRKVYLRMCPDRRWSMSHKLLAIWQCNKLLLYK